MKTEQKQQNNKIYCAVPQKNYSEIKKNVDQPVPVPSS